MSSLGSVFDGVNEGEGTRGKDLRWRGAIAESDVRRERPCAVRVPLRLPDDDGYVVPRVVNPADDEDTIRVQVPASSDFPLTVRLRGMGGVSNDGGPAGDLYLTLELGGVPAVRPASGPTSLVAVGGAGALLIVLGLWLTVCG